MKKMPEFSSRLAPFLRGLIDLRQSLGYADKSVISHLAFSTDFLLPAGTVRGGSPANVLKNGLPRVGHSSRVLGLVACTRCGSWDGSSPRRAPRATFLDLHGGRGSPQAFAPTSIPISS